MCNQIGRRVAALLTDSLPSLRTTGYLLLGMLLLWSSIRPDPLANAQVAERRELIIQNGHISDVHSVAFSSDGKWLASGSADDTIKLWDAATGMLHTTLKGHSSLVASVAFSPDSTRLASGSWDNTLKLWDVATGQLLATLQAHQSVNSVAFSPDGKRLASGSNDKTIRLWDVATGKLVATLENASEFVYSVAFSPDGKRLASGSFDGTVRLWDTANWKMLVNTQGHSHAILSLAFSPDGKQLASAGCDKQDADGKCTAGTVKLWDVATGQLLATLQAHQSWVNSVAFSPDGKSLASAGGEDKTVKLWDATTGLLRATLRDHTSRVSSVAFSPDGRWLASGSSTVKLRQATTGEVLITLAGHSHSVNSVAFSPDGQRMASGHWDNTLKLWDVATGRLQATLRGHAAGITSGTFSPDGKRLASGGWDNTLKLWDATTGQLQVTLPGHKGHVTAVAFSPNGQWFASAGWDKTVRLWDLTTGQLQGTLPHADWVTSVAFSPDSEYIASASGKALTLWHLATGELQLTMTGHKFSVYSVAFSPDGKRLASGSADQTVRLWDTTTSQLQATLTGHSDTVNSVAFSPDGKLLASGSGSFLGDNTVKLWDVATGQLRATLKGHGSAVKALTFSPDNKIIASGSGDTTIKLWNISLGREIASLIAFDQNDYMAVTPDNYYLSSKPALRLVTFRINNKIFPFEQFDLKYNRPDIVLKRIGYAPAELIDSYYKAYQRRLKKMKFTEDMLGDDFHLPEAAIASSNLPAFPEKKDLAFTIKASDSKYLLDRLNVFVNDIPLYGVNGIDLRDKSISALEQPIKLQLSDGRNKIQVSVLNNKGVESLKDTYLTVYKGPPAQPNLYVVSIGISEYLDNQYNLRYAAKDADDLATLLESKKDKFGKIQILRILNKEATKENILKARGFLIKSAVDDEAIVFLAGHGLLDDKLDYYFATTDIDFENPSARGLPYDAVEGLLDGIPARKKILLMDTCHSGEVDKEETVVSETGLSQNVVVANNFRGVIAKGKKGRSLGLKNSFTLLQDMFADLRRGSGAMVISSASGVEFALESSQWKNGVFTFALLDFLRQTGTPRVSELRDSVIKKVEELTNGRQHPTSRRENIDFDFAVFPGG